MIILASASPRRRALLGALLGHPPRVLTADIDESVLAGEAPEAYARRLAEAKARAVAAGLAPETHEADKPAGRVKTAEPVETDDLRPEPPKPPRPLLVLGSDTIVVFEGAILGKPADTEEARACLLRLRGRRHEVITAVALVELRPADPDAFARVETATTGVWMRDYSEAEIAAYVDTGDPLDKAGAYAIQHRGFAPVARLVGSESNVIGLPLGLTARMLRRFGLNL